MGIRINKKDTPEVSRPKQQDREAVLLVLSGVPF